MSNKLLMVDDEKVFLKSLKAGLSHLSTVFKTDICFNFHEAVTLIKQNQYALIITDIRMPGKSGIDLLLHLKKINFEGGVKVMSAFNSEVNLKRINALGIVDVIPKPFDLKWFQNMLVEYFEREDESSVTFESIDLMSVMQVLHLDKKSSALMIDVDRKKGIIYYKDGEIIDAEYNDFKGEAAFIELVTMNRGKISVNKIKGKVKRTINIPFVEFLMNTMKLIDEMSLHRGNKGNRKLMPEENKEDMMAIKEVLKVLEDVNGYLGSGVFTPQGEMLEGSIEVSGITFETAGSLIHDTLKNSKKLAKDAGFGNLSMIQLYTEMGVVFAVCFNEGKLHFHTVLILKTDGNIAMAKMKLSNVVEALKTVL